MIEKTSPIICLPENMGAKQTLFLDGIRHAIEIADCAYRKLADLLTDIALASDRDRPGESRLYTEAFMYAWAFVDAADRFRALVLLLPGLSGDKEVLLRNVLEGFAELRKLRNAADHIAQKADHYVAQKAAALGTLAWVTRISPESAASCVIRPGTVPKSPRFTMVRPNDQLPNEGTSYIYLEVGKVRVCLCEMVMLISAHVRAIEHLLAEGYARRAVTPGSGENRDYLLVAMIEVPPNPESTT